MLFLGTNTNPGQASWVSAPGGSNIVYAQTSSGIEELNGTIGTNTIVRMTGGPVLTIPNGTLQAGDRVYVRYLLQLKRSATPGVLFRVFLYFGTDGVNPALSLITPNAFTPVDNDQGYGDVQLTILTTGVGGTGSALVFGDIPFSGYLQNRVTGGSGVPIDTTVSPFLIQPAVEFDGAGGVPTANDFVRFLYTEVTVVRP